MKMKITVRQSMVMAFSFTFATISIAICAWKLLNWVWLKPKKLEKYLKENGFSGNSYKLFYGDTKEIFRMTIESMSKPISLYDDTVPRIMPFEHHIISNYGKSCFTWFGPTPKINITDPSLIREILYKHEIFQKPKRSPLTKSVVLGMAMYYDDQWSKVRKIANPAFHMEKLKDMVPEIYTSCKDVVGKWKTLASKDESCELDVWPDIQNLTADVISRTAFGRNFEEGRKIFELMKKQVRLMMEISQSVYIPGWRFLPTATNRKVKSNYKEMQKLIIGIINKREDGLKAGKARNNDLLGLLMESNHRAIQQKEAGLSIQEVIEECKLFYLAGQETTASLLVWTIVLLSVHPRWQERAREEVSQVFGNDVPNFDDLNQLKVVTQILYEVLRLYSPSALFERTNTKEVKVGELVLPPGVLFSMPIIIVHRDDEYWGDDAKEFNPDRFSEGVSKASKNNQVAFFPFSWGPRVCIGQNFALIEAKLALAMILQNFSFNLSPTYAHAPARLINLYPQYGVHMTLHKI